ncbi:MAG TPA: hypothetical protein VKS43_06810 [Burkholderiales bacterium]|nr:hypothetical protein [Burkholderiales bacterium]
MLKPGGKERSTRVAIIQAGVALALLIILPVVLGAPETPRGIAVAVVVALTLVAFLLEGIARFIRNKKRPFLDSVMPPQKQPDIERTVIKPPKK